MKARTQHLHVNDLVARGEDIGTVVDFYVAGVVIKWSDELAKMTDAEMDAAGVVLVDGQR